MSLKTGNFLTIPIKFNQNIQLIKKQMLTTIKKKKKNQRSWSSSPTTPSSFSIIMSSKISLKSHPLYSLFLVEARRNICTHWI